MMAGPIPPSAGASPPAVASPPGAPGPSAARAGASPFSALLAAKEGGEPVAATDSGATGNGATSRADEAGDDLPDDAESGDGRGPAEAAVTPLLPLLMPPPPPAVEAVVAGSIMATAVTSPIASAENGPVQADPPADSISAGLLPAGSISAGLLPAGSISAGLLPAGSLSAGLPPAAPQLPEEQGPAVETTPAVPPERQVPLSRPGVHSPAAPPATAGVQPANGSQMPGGGGNAAGDSGGNPAGGNPAAPPPPTDTMAMPPPAMAAALRFELPAGMVSAGSTAGGTAGDDAAPPPAIPAPPPATDCGESPPGSGIHIEIGSGDRLDIGIGLTDAGAAERVRAGLDHLRHELHAIGTEVEAIRVEVRRERGPDGSLPPHDGHRPAAGHSERGNADGKGGNPPHRRGHDMHDGRTQTEEGRLRIRAASPGGRKVDRYA